MLSRLLILLVRLYQRTFSRLLPPNVCIYEPTCSQYMAEALARHGAIRGILLGGWRVLRCHPFAKGGVDLVPERSGRLPTTEELTAAGQKVPDQAT